MDNPELGGNGPEQHAREVLERSKKALSDAVEILAGNRDYNPLEVFPAPTERRDDAEGLNLTEEQESGLRQAAAELGFDRAEDLPPSAVGLQGAHIVFEGGQGHKIKAEVESVLADQGAQPQAFIFASTPHRKIPSDSPEAQITAKVLGLDISEVGTTEYEVAKQVAMQTPGFKALEQEIILPFSYDINNGFTTGTEQTGQLIQFGTIGEVPVILLRIDREDYFDEAEQKNKYRNQPRTSDIIQLVDKSTESKEAPIALITSGTYQTTREIDVIRASLATGRTAGVATYGTVRLAHAKGESSPEPAHINQLPGELHKLAKQVEKLEAALQPKS